MRIRFKVAIPARFASTRLPGKPLLTIGGKPMIQHVYERALASGADEVVIATDDARIAAAADDFGASVCMTSGRHRSGTERIAELVRARGEPPETVIVNVQGDEPLLPPALVSQVAELLARTDAARMATLCEPISEARELFDPAVVKIVCDRRGRALYFSRAPIPWHRGAFAARPGALPEDPIYFRHVGLYAYRAGYLLEYADAPATPLEGVEALEQLRALWNGDWVQVAKAREPAPAGVDTEADLARVRRLLE